MDAQVEEGLTIMGPTIRMRRLAAALRRLREEAGATQDHVVDATGISRNTLYRIESGLTVPKLRDLRTLLALYNAPEEVRCDLEKTRAQARERGWWASEPYSGVSSPELSFYFSLEDEARSVRRWLSTGIHGLLQTPGYARAVETGLTTPTTLVDTRVDLRLARQRRAFGDGRRMQLWTIMDEAVLHRVIGDRSVMADQLQHLIEVSERPGPTITIQILPFTSGIAFQSSADFTIFDLGGDPVEQIASADGTFSVSHFDRPDQLAALSMMFGALSSSALTPQASIELIGAIAKEHRQRGN